MDRLPVTAPTGTEMAYPEHGDLASQEQIVLTEPISITANPIMDADKRACFHASIYHYFQRLEQEEEKAASVIENPNLAEHQSTEAIAAQKLKKHPPANRHVYQGILDEMANSFPYLASSSFLYNSMPVVELRYNSEYENHLSLISKLQNEIKRLERENKDLHEIIKKPDHASDDSRKRRWHDLEGGGDSPKRGRPRNPVKPLSLQANIGKRTDVPDDVKDLVIGMRKEATKEKRNANKKMDRLRKQLETLAAEREQIEMVKDESERKRRESESKKSRAPTITKPRPRTEAEIAEEIKKRNVSTGPLSEEERAQVVARKLELAKAGIPTENITAPQWEERFEELLHFHKGYNHCRVPVRTPGLGRWVAQMRSEYRSIMANPQGQHEKLNSTDPWSLNAERIERLAELGFEFQLTESVPWEMRFNELVEFKAIHGHCKVPRGYKENIKLSEWVHMQRKNYRKRLPSIMGERFEKLDNLGFLWDIKKANPTFETRMEQLRDFRREHGHLYVPPPPLVTNQQRSLEGSNIGALDGEPSMDDEMPGGMDMGEEGNEMTLSIDDEEGTGSGSVPEEEECTDPEVMSFRRWVQRQRDEYNTCYLLGKKSSLDRVRVKKLEELGFSFERVQKPRGPYIQHGHSGRRADPDKYKSRIEKLRIVKEICGDCNKAREIFPDDQILLDWMKAQRKQWKNWQEGRKSSLTTERRQQLEELGFAWQPRAHYAPYGSKLTEKLNSKAEAEAAAASMAQFSHQDFNFYENQV